MIYYYYYMYTLQLLTIALMRLYRVSKSCVKHGLVFFKIAPGFPINFKQDEGQDVEKQVHNEKPCHTGIGTAQGMIDPFAMKHKHTPLIVPTPDTGRRTIAWIHSPVFVMQQTRQILTAPGSCPSHTRYHKQYHNRVCHNKKSPNQRLIPHVTIG